MEYEAELHRCLASGLEEDIVKSLKLLFDGQHKIRKQVELMVDRTSKSLTDRRNEETKAQKQSYSCTKENERLKEQNFESRFSKGKLKSNSIQLENKQKKAEEAMIKADLEYYTSCVKAERVRQEWESAVYRASSQFQQLEEERLAHMQDIVQKYANHISVLGPKMIQICDKLNEAVSKIDVEGDIQVAIKSKGTGPNSPEQFLPNFYAENIQNFMNRDRRKESLEKFKSMLSRDIEMERKGKEGVENLEKAFIGNPNFGNFDAQQEVGQKLYNLRVMLAYLEASHHKVECALADLENKSRPMHPLTAHMEQYRDKQSVIHTVLKLPDSWVERTDHRLSSSTWSSNSELNEVDRGADDVTSPIQNTFDEATFSHSSEVYTNFPSLQTTNSNAHGLCQALYFYQANLDDELTIYAGDLIKILEKIDINWWKGDLNGKVGLFPSTYVQEL
ncbi:nostrin-like [Tachypleus tridentatus]|uniref:nostrin-like n=1 Tax=Tachypleus tridentatus TaxID=6853 RepID=UPI003FD645CC